MRNTFLVCYDISDDVRLRRVHKTMCGYGDRLQYSVFECKLAPADLARCKHALGKLIHHREDQVLFVDLGPAGGRGDRVIAALGRAYNTLDSPCIIVDRDDAEERVPGTKRRVEAIERARIERCERTRDDNDDEERTE